MGILDRYVLRLYVKVLLVLFLSVTGLFIVIDTFSNLEEFISYGERYGGGAKGVLAVLGDYYGARVLTFFDRMNGLLSLAAAMFAVTWLQRTNELIAIMAGGVPQMRMVKPLLCAALAVSLVGIVNRELLIPQFRSKLTRNAQNWLGETAQSLTPRYDNQTNIKFSGARTVAHDERVEGVSLRLPSEFSAFGRTLTAQVAFYKSAEEDRPAGYLLEGVEKPANDLSSYDSVFINQTPVLLSPKDTPWLKPNQCFVVSDLTFEQLVANNLSQQFSSSKELIAGLHNPSLSYGADVRVLVHSRFVQPLLDLALLFLGLPLVVTRDNRNVFVAAGQCFGLVGVFMLVCLTCQALGSNYLISPSLAAWSPLMLFGPAAYVTAKPMWN